MDPFSHMQDEQPVQDSHLDEPPGSRLAILQLNGNHHIRQRLSHNLLSGKLYRWATLRHSLQCLSIQRCV